MEGSTESKAGSAMLPASENRVLKVASEVGGTVGGVTAPREALDSQRLWEWEQQKQ